MFQVGQSVQVMDPINAYYGDVAEVIDVSQFGDIVVLTCEIPFSERSSVSFALRAEKAALLEEA